MVLKRAWARSFEGEGKERWLSVKMVATNSAKAKWTEGAICIALRIPKPFNLTGRVAWIQAGSYAVSQVLVTILNVSCRVSSYFVNSLERKQGAVRSRYYNLGQARSDAARQESHEQPGT